MRELDQSLEAAYDWLDNVKSKIKDWHLLLFVQVNAVIVSVVTTGYMGEDTVQLLSWSGAWYVGMFIMVMLMSAMQIRLKAVFLYKIFTAGALTFLVTWNILALIQPQADFVPWVASIIGQIVVYTGVIFSLKWCYTGNHDIRQQVAISQSDYEEFMRLKQAQSNVISLDQASEG